MKQFFSDLIQTLFTFNFGFPILFIYFDTVPDS